MLRDICLFALLCAWAAPGRALERPQDAEEEIGAGTSILGPRLALHFDESARALRPIAGLPGAATVGPALAAEMEITQVANPPSPDWVLAVAGEERRVAVARLTGGAIALVPVDGAAPDPERLVLSPSGTAAISKFSAPNSRCTGLCTVAPSAG